MKIKHGLLTFAFLAVNTLLLAQTVYIPSGTGGIGTSSNSNVGIGTISPATSGGGGTPRTLEIQGMSGQTVPWGQLVLSSPNAGSANDVLGGIEFASRAVAYQRAGYIYSFKEDSSTTAATARLEFGVTNGGISYTAMTVKSSGNVGVGTVSPAASVDIWKPYSAGTDSLRFSYNDGSTYWMGIQPYVVGAGNVGYKFRTTNNTATVEAFAITGTGNVGIGTTNPTQKLSVNGTIRAKEVIVDTGWSDYVFDDTYRLAPLSEVESHIKEHKHLPGIPSASEVAQHGVSMGDMQARLLAKIEELMLHQIAQEKRLNSQAERLAQLEHENAALKHR